MPVPTFAWYLGVEERKEDQLDREVSQGEREGEGTAGRGGAHPEGVEVQGPQAG